MALDRTTDDAETTRTASPTAHLLEELALYAHRPYDDETDPRPLPEPVKLHGALTDMFEGWLRPCPIRAWSRTSTPSCGRS